MSLGRWAFDIATAGPRAELAHAVETGRNVQDGTRMLYATARFADQYRAAGRERVGAELWHSSEDRLRAVQEIAGEFQAFQSDLAQGLAARAAARKATDTSPSDEIWVKADIVPTLTEWQAFAARETSSWITRFTTTWEVYEDWKDKLRHLRALARAHGLILTSPEPRDLPRTVWDRGTSGSGSMTDTWLGAAKVVVLAAVGVTGFVTLYSAIRDLRGHDH